MRGLTASDLISVWEAGSAAGRLERPLAAIGACVPERSGEEIAALPIGTRDALLLQVHLATFGPRLEGLARCHACPETVEFALAVDALPPLPGPAFDAPRFQRVEVDGDVLEFRLPDSRDLAAAAEAAGPREARQFLARCCVPGEGALAERLVDALSVELGRRQPWADIEVALVCPACSTSWDAPLDVGSFVWDEIAAEARRVVHEVHRLARAYGWREADILAMTPARRRTYLALVE
jgi:hypothetical protein